MNELFAPDNLTWANAILKLIAAILLPLAIGLERFWHRKPIDFRPFVIISVVACAVLIATLDFPLTGGRTVESVDATKVMQGVLTGIGFLGAGAMYRQGDYVKGAASAASIWSAGVIGLICGIGELWLAGGVTFMIVALMFLSEPFTKRWSNEDD
ncbi:MgtC/SapB family protein [Cognatishimia maritima]|uniref:Protein MgtC n=1 Tax=Cognatishimia maritima TaxID=870908 RepID=A0A1M5UXI8_9RHOB|nr:MgtC/SapB family protein [Cognatishimia maritima]SHH67558.1 putative Mg2+ transporter-C (MgtC) family protein [Cognatishimia maritima]